MWLYLIIVHPFSLTIFFLSHCLLFIMSTLSLLISRRHYSKVSNISFYIQTVITVVVHFEGKFDSNDNFHNHKSNAFCVYNIRIFSTTKNYSKEILFRSGENKQHKYIFLKLNLITVHLYIVIIDKHTKLMNKRKRFSAATGL